MLQPDARLIWNTSASTWGVLPHYPHKQKEGNSYTHSLNPGTIFNSLMGVSCSEPTYYFYIHIMKHILYHQLLSKDQITWLPLQFGSKWNLYPQILGIKTAFSPAPCEFWIKAVMIPHVIQARSSSSNLIVVWGFKKKKKKSFEPLKNMISLSQMGENRAASSGTGFQNSRKHCYPSSYWSKLHLYPHGEANCSLDPQHWHLLIFRSAAVQTARYSLHLSFSFKTNM